MTFLRVIDDHKNKRTLNVDLGEQIHDTKDMGGEREDEEDWV